MSSFNYEKNETLVAFAHSKGGSVYIGITSNSQNILKWHYPLKAIINMIVHHNYHSSSKSFVNIFDNKIEFYNSSRLPENISTDDFFYNSYKSTSRNILITEFCKSMGLIEKYFSGINTDYFEK